MKLKALLKKSPLIICLLLVLLVVLIFAVRSFLISPKKEAGTKTEKLSSEKETETSQETYAFQTTGLGINATYIFSLLESDGNILMLAEIMQDIDNTEFFLIRCDKEGKNAEKFSIDLKKGEQVNSMLKNGDGIYILTSVTKTATKFYCKKIDNDGAVTDSLELRSKTKNEFLPLSTAVFNEDGELYLISEDKNSVIIFGKDGKETKRITGNFHPSSLLKTDSIYAYGDGENGIELKKIEKESGSFTDTVSLDGVDFSSMLSIQGASDAVYISDQHNLYSLDLTAGSVTPLFGWIDAGISGFSIQSCFLAEKEDFFAASIPFPSETEETPEVTLITAKKSSDPATERKILTLGVSSLNIDNMEEMVLSFNAENKNYKIKVKDYSQYEDPYTQMNLDILSGNIPDILALDSLPSDQYIKKGLLTDLYPLLENDKELKREDFVDSILSSIENDGKLYYFAPSFGITNSIAVGKDYLDSSEPLGMEGLEKLSEKVPKDGMLMNMTSQQFVRLMLTYRMEDYIDEENNKAEFDSDYFIQMLSFAETLQDENDIDYGKVIDSWQEIQKGMMLAYPFKLSLVDIAILNTVFKEAGGYQVFGYPSKENDDALAAELSSPLAITEQCENKEGAWEFIRKFFTRDAELQSASVNSFWFLPTRKDALEEKFLGAMAEEAYTDENGREIAPMYHNINGLAFAPMTSEDITTVRDLIERIKKIVNVSDDRIQQIISIADEETAAFFAGDKTAKETAEIIQNRAQIYLSETS